MTNSKPVLWLLILSFAVNVFLATVICVHLVGGPPFPFDRPRPIDIINDMASHLPIADASILREVAGAYRVDLEREDRPDEKGFEVVNQALRAEPFDVDAFRRALEAQRLGHEHLGTVIDRVLLEAVPRFSAEGRKMMAEHRPPAGPGPGPRPGPGPGR